MSTMVAPLELPDGESALHAPPGFLGWVAALVHRQRGRLIGYARRRGLGPEDALDVVQDSFVSFLRLPEARGIAEEQDALKLLTVILRHNVQNQRRKRTRHSRFQTLLEVEPALSAPADDSEALIARAEELGRARGCILRMARLQRRVILLSLLDDVPRERVSALLGVSESYARVLLHRARHHLRHCDEHELA